MTTDPTRMEPLGQDYKQHGAAVMRRFLALARVAPGAIAAAFFAFIGRKASTSNMRHQTLLLLRWLAIGGQTAAILIVDFLLHHKLPLLWCSLPILASAWLNIFLMIRYPMNHRLSDREAAIFMGWDIIQLATLLYFTGGLLNPFSLLFLAPVTIAASSLSRRSVTILVALGLACVTFLALFGWHWPLPWEEGSDFDIPRRYEVGMWVAMVIGILFSSIFAWRVAAEAGRMSDALSATEMILAREQRLSAVGGLAAAAAHELGTPLATISVVAKELQREVKSGPLAEDIALLTSQAERCREILNRLTREAEASASVHQSTADLRDVLEEIAQPHRIFGVTVRVDMKIDPRHPPPNYDGTGRGPRVRRRPEFLYGLGNFIENAVDFANELVVVEALCASSTIRVRIMDDGPGFPRDVLERLGEPFTSTRSRLADVDEGISLEESHGMGLGFFIAKTLLERTGARVVAGNRNAEPGAAPATQGAVVSITWPRDELEAKGTGPAEFAQI